MAIQLEVWGEYALFTRPEMKVERVSYDVMTPSAARGIVDAIYYHPGLKWTIDRIHVLPPFGAEAPSDPASAIRFASIRRNEVKSKISATSVSAVMHGGRAPLFLNTAEDIQQRAATVLQDVHYVIEAHFDMTDKAALTDNPGKFQDIVKRRMASGQCFHTPYFGCREFPVRFRPWAGGKIPAVDLTRDLGYMLYDMDYSNEPDIQPMFFRAQLVHGVLDLRDCEVRR